MRIGIATDHGGFGLNEELVEKLRAAGHDVVDFGAHGLSPADDYPDYVVPLARAVVAGTVERGVAICESGVGAEVMKFGGWQRLNAEYAKQFGVETPGRPPNAPKR